MGIVNQGCSKPLCECVASCCQPFAKWWPKHWHIARTTRIYFVSTACLLCTAIAENRENCCHQSDINIYIYNLLLIKVPTGCGFNASRKYEDCHDQWVCKSGWFSTRFARWYGAPFQHLVLPTDKPGPIQAGRPTECIVTVLFCQSVEIRVL